MVLVAGITFIACLGMPLKRILYFSPLVVLLVVLNSGNLDYYTSRVNVSSDNQNLSTLVYFSGWERAYLNVKETFGLGVGFQQFGVIGIAILVFYLSYFAKIMWWTRKVILGEAQHQNGLMLFFLSSFVMYFIDLFFRSTGYFSSSGFIFIASLMWIISVKSPNYLWLNTSVIPKSTS